MQIEISLQRPGVILLMIAAVSGWSLHWTSGQPEAASVIEAPPMQATAASVSSAAAVHPFALTAQVSTPMPSPVETSGLTEAEMRIKWTRAEQEFLRQREDIIRQQLEGLQKQRETLGPTIDSGLEEQFRRAVQMLTSLVRDQQKAEQFLLTSYRQEWEAEERAMAAAQGPQTRTIAVVWPVEPKIGVSASFLDAGYKQRFKVDHYAIDIPVLQGTTVLAAADGIVKDVVDHGLGYNYITIEHGGSSTVYGHMSDFSVRPGQRVRAGDIIGTSGGMPGLPGGGKSTGPHLHFGLYVKGVPVDPLQYLPEYKS